MTDSEKDTCTLTMVFDSAFQIIRRLTGQHIPEVTQMTVKPWLLDINGRNGLVLQRDKSRGAFDEFTI